jgi:hypothetical protein
MLLSTILVTVFLINNFYATSASPMLSADGVAGGESLDLRTNSVANYVPDDQKCPQPSLWYGRGCHPDRGDRAWYDVCRYNPGQNVFYTKPGTCPENTMCQDTITQDDEDPEPRDTVSCIERPTNTNQVHPNQQVGVYIVEGSGTTDAQRVVSVGIELNLARASVTALIEGAY